MLTLTVPPRSVVPSDPSFLLLLTSWLYFYNCSILLVILGGFPLSSCLQYLYTDGHLCPTFILAEVSVHVPSALPTVEMSSLILVGSFQPCPVSQLELSWARELFCTAMHLFYLPQLGPLHSKSNLVISPIAYQTKAALYAELSLLPRVTFALIAVLTSCLTPWQPPRSHIRLFRVYLQRLFLLSVLSASPISLPLSCSTSETQLISFRCLSVSPAALIG